LRTFLICHPPQLHDPILLAAQAHVGWDDTTLTTKLG
jgi:hypothetical protein